jgi:hypothetical protein
MPVIFGCAYLSWHAIERPALDACRRFVARRAARHDAMSATDSSPAGIAHPHAVDTNAIGVSVIDAAPARVIDANAS